MNEPPLIVQTDRAVLLETQHPERTAFNDHAWERCEIAEHHRIQGIAVGRGRARDESPIIGINKARNERPGELKDAQTRLIFDLYP